MDPLGRVNNPPHPVNKKEICYQYHQVIIIFGIIFHLMAYIRCTITLESVTFISDEHGGYLYIQDLTDQNIIPNISLSGIITLTVIIYQ